MSVLSLNLCVHVRKANVCPSACVPFYYYGLLMIHILGGKCRQWKAGFLVMRALKMQEAVSACTNPHDALKITPTAFVN